MELEDKIEGILEELKSRTSWGVMLDLIEIVELREKSKNSVKILDIAIEKIEDFTKNYIPDPKTPDEEEA